MRRAAPIRLACILAAVATSAFPVTPSARACLFSNVASAYANGVAARRVTILPADSRGEAVWAPFAFRQHFTTGRTVRLREDMREVAQSLGRAALQWRVRWLFGDGTSAAGVAVSHTYQRHGLYKIEVQSYYDGGRGRRGWYDFDAIDLAVGPPPADMAWMTAPPATGSTPTPAAVVATPTPTPLPTGASGG